MSGERLAPWVLRILWLVTGVVTSAVVDDTLGDGAGPTVVRLALGLGWVGGVAAMALPAVRSLTAVRAIVPLAVPATSCLWAAGAPTLGAVTAAGLAALTGVVAFSAAVGRSFVQASAYGSEDRHLLRPPAAYLAAAVLSWVIAAGLATAGLVLLGAERWIVGGIATVAGLAVGIWAVPRWHRLSRRWLVVVPVGLVVHDPLVLGETLMLRRNEIGSVALARAGTEAADLTGPAGGHAVEISTTQPVTAIFASTPSEPGGRAIHLTACLVAPTRPGRAIAAVRGA